MAVIGQQIGQSLIDALGLPKNLISFELRVAANEVVSVRCEYLPDDLDGAALQSAFAEYELVERSAPKEQTPFNFDAWMSGRKEAAHAAMLERDKELSRIDARMEWDRLMSQLEGAES